MRNAGFSVQLQHMPAEEGTGGVRLERRLDGAVLAEHECFQHNQNYRHEHRSELAAKMVEEVRRTVRR